MERLGLPVNCLTRTAIILALSLTCQFAVSSSVSNEREELVALEKQMSQVDAAIGSAKSEAEALPSRVEKAQSALQKADAEYEAEQAVLSKAQQEQAASPSESSKRQVRLAEIKAGLAETRKRTAERNLEKVKDQLQTAEQKIADAESRKTALAGNIQAQQRRLDDAIALEAKQKEEQAKKTAAAAVKPKAPAVAIKAPELPKPAPQPEPKVSPEPVVAKTPVKSENPDIIRLAEGDYDSYLFAVEQFSLAQENAGRKNVQAVEGLSLNGSDIDSVAFVHLGNHQYRADVILSRGKQDFRIRGLKFQLDISREDAKQEFVFLVDARNINDMHARYFKKQYLSYMGKTVLKVEKKPSIDPSDVEKELLLAKEASQAAKARLAETESLASAVGNVVPDYDELVLAGSEIENSKFDYLGNHQYRVDVPLKGGRQDFRVRGLRFQLNIPKSESLEEYVFLVDAREKNDLKASYFKKDLLSFGSQAAAAN